MPVDRVLLRAPIDQIRTMLEGNGVELYVPDEETAKLVRGQFRFDLGSVGVDMASEEQVAGAIAGIVATIKALLTFNLPPEYVGQYISLFDCIEPILDEDVDSMVTRLRAPEMPVPEHLRDVAKAAGVVIPEDSSFRDMSEEAARMTRHRSFTATPRVGGPAFDRPADPSPDLEKRLQAMQDEISQVVSTIDDTLDVLGDLATRLRRKLMEEWS